MVERSFSFDTAVAITGNFAFQRQAIPRPEMRLAGGVKNRDGPVAIELDLEDPIRAIKRRFCTLRHHRRDEIGEGLFGHFSEESEINSKRRA